jgi:hypothetical protein
MLADPEIFEASNRHFKPLLSFACQPPVLHERLLAVLGEIEIPTQLEMGLRSPALLAA